MRTPALLALALAVLAGGAFALHARGDDGPPPGRVAIERYLAAWSRGDDRAAAVLTDRGDAAAKALRLSRAGLDGAHVDARLLAYEDDRARARVRWTVPRIGAWEYEVRIRARELDGDAWLVAWHDRIVQPRLSAATRLGTTVERPRRAPILDRRGRPLVSERPVVDVAVEVGAVTSPGATAGALAAVLDVEAGPLERRIEAAGKGRFIPVITLREADFDRAARALGRIRAVSLNRTTAQLAPTPSFARALLGSVGPVTAEQLERSGGRLAPGDQTGQSGLEARYDERLAGTAERRVLIRDRTTGDAQATLLRRPGREGRAVRTLLDRDVQAAAEQALDGTDDAALVAVQPSSGDVLGAANRPADTGFDRALLGRYPPGSTFKVVTTAALLRAGLSPGETVDCPATLVVDGKSFRNFEGGAAGAVPFREDFAQSCNTAFVSLADRLGRRDLTQVARDFGLGERLAPGAPAAAADVPPPRDAVGQAAMTIGQDRILASPLAMAGVAATVAAGRWRAPRVLPGAARRARAAAGRRRAGHAAHAHARRGDRRDRHGARRRPGDGPRQERHRGVRRRRSAPDPRLVHRRARRPRDRGARGARGVGRARRRAGRRALLRGARLSRVAAPSMFGGVTRRENGGVAMDVGIGLPATIAGTEREQLLDWARRAEARGFSSLGTIDRLVYGNYEPLIALAAAAAVTERIRLATAILIAPYRANGALVAKQAASLDRLSRGRLVLGVAVGGRADDYEASGVDFHTRGKRFDELLDEWRRIWAGESFGTAGAIGPAPPNGRPALVVGGTVEATYARAARYGDGWIMGGGAPDQFKEGAARMRAAWEAAGREGAPRTMALALLRARRRRRGGGRRLPARLLRVPRRLRRHDRRQRGDRRGDGAAVRPGVRGRGLRRAAADALQPRSRAGGPAGRRDRA